MPETEIRRRWTAAQENLIATSDAIDNIQSDRQRWKPSATSNDDRQEPADGGRAGRPTLDNRADKTHHTCPTDGTGHRGSERCFGASARNEPTVPRGGPLLALTHMLLPPPGDHSRLRRRRRWRLAAMGSARRTRARRSTTAQSSPRTPRSGGWRPPRRTWRLATLRRMCAS